MSILGKKPKIESILEQLSTSDLNLLEGLFDTAPLNIPEYSPSTLPAVPASNVFLARLSGLTGYAVYSGAKYFFISYDNLNCDEYSIESDNRLAEIDEKLTMLELRYEANAIATTRNIGISDVFYDPTKLAYANNIRNAWNPATIDASNKYKDDTNLIYMPWIDTSSVTDMEYMFFDCSSLTSVPAFNTSSVTDMEYMFFDCSSLTSVPAFNTSSVTNMGHMFNKCSSLTSVPAFNTSSVTIMNDMFNKCSSLTSVPAFNTSSVTIMNDMFNKCSSLTSVPAFNTSSVTYMRGMFSDCSSLTSVPAFNTSSVTDMEYMFFDCSSLMSVHMTGMKVSFNISASVLFTRDALLEIINNCATVATATTLTMGATNLAKLTADDKLIATNKGWTLA